MARKSLGTLILITLCAIIVLAIVIGPTAQQTSAQTIPSRTPTPSGDDPSPTPPDDGNGDPDPTAPPTSTSVPTATPTNTPVPLPPTPEDGYLPTAEPCSNEPMLQSEAGGVNARSGPGLNYEVIAQLEFLEVRPIVGRAQFATWWQINLADGTLVWVSNTFANVSGYVGGVPTVEAPPLSDGSTPTPGAPWDPTPRPNCTPPPSETPSATPSQTPTGTATSTGTPSPENGGGGSAESDETATGTPAPTASATNSATPSSASAEEAEATSAPAGADATPEVEPLPGEGDAETGIPWLPIAGVGLIVVAAVLFVFRRNAA